ncbi:peptidase inhibitor family I36 protein [Micromonospora peucetia]|uniref:peptidase inhibitor family I36 protein n=1 Tax=Micromonospora peucetia TaxID=47871 RepID=UPI00331C2547
MKVKTVIASAFIVGSGLFLVPGVASAALQDCDSNHMCMWANNDFGVMIGERPHNQATVVNLSSTNNDRMDSWANRSAQYAGCMFSDAGGAGDRQTMGLNSNDNNVSPLNSDEVTSWRTANGC